MKTKRVKKLKQPCVGRLIRELRLLLGLTQEEMATILGVSFSTVSRWERGRANPSPIASKLIEIKLTKLGERGEKLLERYSKEADAPLESNSSA